MRITILFFCLFLYICLVWVIVAIRYTGQDVENNGLFWTAAGLSTVLALVIGVQLFGWLRLWRLKAPARVPPPPKPAVPVSAEQSQMAGLLTEANEVLAKSPAFAGIRRPISGMPLYLLIGPESVGKTSTFLNSGLEPQLLAGNGANPGAPTRLCNLWLVGNVIFVDFSGKEFGSDLGRWGQLLEALRGREAISTWRKLLGEVEQQMDLRGVVAFCAADDLANGSSDPQGLERRSREWQDRLRTIADRFGVDFPVYVVITNSDKVPYFTEFFRRLPESERNQVLGCTLAIHRPSEASPGEIFVQAEAKRLTSSFRPLYLSLARRRLTQLSYEPQLAQRLGIYEFPRELKRMRSPLVQFLTEVFRPNTLGAAPHLRGFYFTACQETEAVASVESTSREFAVPGLTDTTGLFRSEATHIFKVDTDKDARRGAQGRTSRRWMFVADLFRHVVLADRPIATVRPAAPDHLEWKRTFALGAVCAVCASLCFAFFLSWILNRGLMADVRTVPKPVTERRDRLATIEDLHSLDALREQVVRLQAGQGWSYHWGLYTGDRLLELTRTSYFRRVGHLLLNDVNNLMASDLRTLGYNSPANASFDSVHQLLKTHLTISAGGCSVDPPEAERVLKDYRGRLAPSAATRWRDLADVQIDFYARQLAKGNPAPLHQDTEGRDSARQYLQKITGVDKFYSSIVAGVAKKLEKRSRLSDMVPKYTEVLSGPDEVSPVFSSEGWNLVEKASKEQTFASGEPCVVGKAPGMVKEAIQENEIARAIQRKYFGDYVDHWRKFIEGFSVVRYANAGDAARKLEVLESHRSPLLAVLLMTANNTNFPRQTGAVDGVLANIPGADRFRKVMQKADDKAKSVVDGTGEARGALNSPADISRAFQPVHWVEPPGSESWILDKNAAYIDALSQLRSSMKDIAQGGSTPDPAVHQTAEKNYEKALDASRQIARGFKPIGIDVDIAVQKLLEQPIKLTANFILKDIEQAGTDKINRELRQFCASVRKAMSRYPFHQNSTDDASLEDLSAIFEPGRGSLWKFQLESLGPLVVKEGAQWKSADPAKKPQLTREMSGFLNRSQAIADAFFAVRGGPPQFTYTMRPKLDSRWSGATLELNVNGHPFNWTSSLQHQFSWPAPVQGSAEPGATVWLRPGTVGGFSIASRGGEIWGVFRVLGDAEPREPGARVVEWKYLQGGRGGRREPIEPAPVHLEIVGFPGGQDVFNPRFWEGLRCPAVAVQ